MKIDFAKLNGILEAKAGRAIDRLDGLKCYTPEFQETLDAILFMLDASKELDTYDTECQDCKQRKEAAGEALGLNSNDPRSLIGKGYNRFTKDSLASKHAVMFYSDHCAPCQHLKPILEKYVTNKGIDVDWVLVDQQEAMKHTVDHEVRGWPTLLVVDDGLIVDITTGSDSNLSEELTTARLDNFFSKYFE